jgi:hypothetical protein
MDKSTGLPAISERHQHVALTADIAGMQRRKTIPAGFISEVAMAEKLDKCVGTLRRWGMRGYGPKRFKKGKEVIYREDGDQRWLNGIEQEEPRERSAPRRPGRPRLTEMAEASL